VFFFSSRPTAAVVASAVGCGSSCGSGRCRLHHPTITVGADGLIGRGRRCAQAFPSWLALHPHSFVSTQQSNSKSSSQKSCFGSAAADLPQGRRQHSTVAAAAAESIGGSGKQSVAALVVMAAVRAAVQCSGNGSGGGCGGGSGNGHGKLRQQWQWNSR